MHGHFQIQARNALESPSAWLKGHRTPTTPTVPPPSPSCLLRLIHGYLLLKIWLKSRLSHVYGIYVIVNELRFPGCFDWILVRME